MTNTMTMRAVVLVALMAIGCGEVTAAMTEPDGGDAGAAGTSGSAGAAAGGAGGSSAAGTSGSAGDTGGAGTSGGAGTTGAAGATGQAGTGGAPCSVSPGDQVCGGNCTNVFRDTYNCGRCGVVCGPGARCDS